MRISCLIRNSLFSSLHNSSISSLYEAGPKAITFLENFPITSKNLNFASLIIQLSPEAK